MMQEKSFFFSVTLFIVLVTYCLIPYFINIIAGVCPRQGSPGCSLRLQVFSKKLVAIDNTDCPSYLVLLGQEHFVQTSNMAMNTSTRGAGGCWHKWMQ